MWEGLYKVVEEYLSSITIADLANTGESADQYII
jgi:DNA-binding IscR family transcriptional regulator